MPAKQQQDSSADAPVDMAAMIAQAVAAAMAAQAPPVVEAAPTSDNAKATAAKGKRITVPTHTVTDDDGVRWSLDQAYESRPGHEASVKYREPRVRIMKKGPSDDDFRKVGTLAPDVLRIVSGLSAAQVTKLTTDARS